ncbi:MAG: hypothetical protein Q8O67_28685 [Deltaproteobacteria bacterium]|nr:hypothetical protein [Deltaproteobacteria bacterium]
MTSVQFYAPPLGLEASPMGLSGDGEIDSTAEGLVLRGQMGSSGAARGLGCGGFVVGFIAAPVLIAVTNTPVGTPLGMAILILVGVALPIGGVFFARQKFPARPQEILIPWAKVKKLGQFGPHVTFESKGKPAGQVWFAVPEQEKLISPPPGADQLQIVKLKMAVRQELIDSIKAKAAASGVVL